MAGLGAALGPCLPGPASLPALPAPTFSRISSARLHSGSASLYLPRLPYRTARLFNVAATWGGGGGTMEAQ